MVRTLRNRLENQSHTQDEYLMLVMKSSGRRRSSRFLSLSTHPGKINRSRRFEIGGAIISPREIIEHKEAFIPVCTPIEDSSFAQQSVTKFLREQKVHFSSLVI